jgi:hypothetical protein
VYRIVEENLQNMISCCKGGRVGKSYQNIHVLANVAFRVSSDDLLDGRTRIKLLTSSHDEIGNLVVDCRVSG